MQRFLPSVDLQPFVKDFIFMNDARPLGTLPERLIPDGDFLLAINLENGYIAQHPMNTYAATLPATGYLHAHAQRAYYLHKTGHYRGIALHLTPDGMYQLLRTSLFELPLDSIFTTEELFGKWGKDLAERLCECATPKAQLAYLEQQLRQKLNKNHWNGESMMSILNWVGQHHDKVSVQNVAEHFFISRKTLERRFLQRVGVTPKQYMRMIRFRNAYTQLSLHNYHEMMDLVEENGYFDQMHMIKDFKQFIGATPSELLKSPNFMQPSYHTQYRRLSTEPSTIHQF